VIKEQLLKRCAVIKEVA